MEKIKLVIWDLDNTFWKGTLSEEKITLNQKNVTILKALTNRGIINSIASKNAFENVQNVLKKENLWNYFVFPHIAWLPKGELVHNIIKKCQLRPPNVLFIDDNQFNLEEVKFYSKGINVRRPNFLDEILKHKAFIGEEDHSNSRLMYYKTLERKDVDKQYYSDNYEFLQQSNIKVELICKLDSLVDRIFELVTRTNQLNFTKKRISKEEIISLINNKNYEYKCISANDKYGNYGIIGFYALEKKTFFLEHFIFSCRILHMGIEQFIYSILNYPKLSVVPEISVELKKDYIPTWISLEKREKKGDKHIFNNNRKKIKILIKAGCDLSAVMHYLSYKNLIVDTEFNEVSSDNHTVRRDHTIFLKNYIELDDESKEAILKNIPFFDKTIFQTKVYDNDYSFFIYSPLMDYTQPLYKHKTLQYKIAYGQYNNLLDDIKKKSNKIIEDYKEQKIYNINEKYLEYFKNNFEYLGLISADEFIKNLKFIKRKINKPMIIINGSEMLPRDNDAINQLKRHKEMNQALKKLINDHDGFYLLDVNEIINKPEDMRNSIRHYNRHIYIKIADKLRELISDMTNQKFTLNKQFYLFMKYKKKFIDQLNNRTIIKVLRYIGSPFSRKIERYLNQ